RAGSKLIVIGAILKLEGFRRLLLDEGSIIIECALGRLVDVSGGGAETFHKTSAESLRVELPLPGDRFEQDQRAISVMGLVSRLLAVVVVSRLRRLETIHPSRIKD